MEFKRKMLDEGKTIHNDRQASDMAAPHWNALSQQEKDFYKDKAKKTEPFVNKKRIIYNSMGRDTAEIEAEELKAREEYNLMIRNIQLMLNEANDVGGKIYFYLEPIFTLNCFFSKF